MAAKKKAVALPPPLFDFPCTTTWYDVKEDRDKIPRNVWCLLWAVDVDGELGVYQGRFSERLSTWLSPTSGAIEESDSVLKYSPIFTPEGRLWTVG